MKKFIFFHYAFFGYVQFMGVFLYGYFPEMPVFPYLALLISFAYLIFDTLFYYKNYKKNGKHKHAKALLIYDSVVFAYTGFVYILLYLVPFILDLSYSDFPSAQTLFRLIIVFVLQITYLIFRGLCHKEIFKKN